MIRGRENGMEDVKGMRAEDACWVLHQRGLAPSQIARELGCTADFARHAVTARWLEDKLAHDRTRGA